MSTAKRQQFRAGTTIRIAVADTVISIGAADFLEAVQPSAGVWQGYSAAMILITPVTNPVYYAYNTDPTPDGSIGHPLPVGSELEVINWLNIGAIRFVRQDEEDGAIMLTPFYGG